MGIYSAAKDAANTLKEAGKIEEYQKILDLIDDLFSKREKIEKLTEEIKDLKKSLNIKDSHEFKHNKNAYFNKETKDGPFCSRCFDKNKNLIRLIPNKISGNYATCPECNTRVNYNGKENPIKTFHPKRNRAI